MFVTAAVYDQLRNGELDVVIGRFRSNDGIHDLTFEPLYEESLVFVTGPSHPLAGKSPSLQDVATYPILLTRKKSFSHQEIMHYFAENGLQTIVDVVETNSADFMRSYLAKTDSIAVGPRGPVQADIERGDLCDLNIGGNELTGKIGLTLNPARDLPTAVAIFLRQLRANPHLYQN